MRTQKGTRKPHASPTKPPQKHPVRSPDRTRDGTARVLSAWIVANASPSTVASKGRYPRLIFLPRTDKRCRPLYGDRLREICPLFAPRRAGAAFPTSEFTPLCYCRPRISATELFGR